MAQCIRGAIRLADLVTLPAAGVGSTSTYIRYVMPGSDPVEVAASLPATLIGSFSLAALGTGGVGVTVAGVAYLRFRPLPNDIRALRRMMVSYGSLLPWFLRLAVGLPLAGAGSSGYFFSPTVQSSSSVLIRLFGVMVGFLLLLGFGTRLVAAIGLGTYLVGLAVEPALVLASEYMSGFLAIALVGDGRPSADRVIASTTADDRMFYSRIDPSYRRVALPFAEWTRHFEACVPAVLRIGLGLAFIYLGVAQKLMEPDNTLAVTAKYDLAAAVLVAPELQVIGAGLIKAFVDVLLVGGVFTRAASDVTLLLSAMTLFGLPDDFVLTHISLFGLVLALLVTGGGPLSVDHTLSSRGADGAESNSDTSGRSAGA